MPDKYVAKYQRDFGSDEIELYSGSDAKEAESQAKAWKAAHGGRVTINGKVYAG